MKAMKVLPPLQAAIELGDVRLLEEELNQWEGVKAVHESFGECKSVVEAVVKMARERLLIWREVEITLREVLRQVEKLPESVPALAECCHRLFRAVKDAQLT